MKNKLTIVDTILAITILSLMAFLAAFPYKYSLLSSFGWSSNQVCCLKDFVDIKTFLMFFSVILIAAFLLGKVQMKNNKRNALATLTLILLISSSYIFGKIRANLIKNNPKPNTFITSSEGEIVKIKKITTMHNSTLGLKCDENIINCKSVIYYSH